MGKYKKELNIIFLADLLDPSLINIKVWLRNNTPQTVAIMAEFMPVIPNFAGSRPRGIRNKVYIII